MFKGTPIEAGYYSLLQRHLVPRLMILKVKPNHITFMGLFVSLGAGLSFAYSPLLGGLFTLLTGLLDTLDGSLARALGQTRKFGAFLDSVLDRYTEFIIFLGIWCYFYRQGASTPFFSLVILLILFGSLMVSYTRARAEGLGEPCMVGLFQRGERIVLIGLAGIFNPLVNRWIGLSAGHWGQDITLTLVLLVLAVGTNWTALWRFLHVLNNLRK
ncbi:MAG: CDP-alcohol phosphatidyltransferase family protein [Deltaproteobacteria bacterium]|nr:CDP-alcohol phosphatidyltransferase family protein [Deltaproteobacteria bacterium]